MTLWLFYSYDERVVFSVGDYAPTALAANIAFDSNQNRLASPDAKPQTSYYVADFAVGIDKPYNNL